MNYLVLRRAVMRYYMPLGSPPPLSYNMQALDIHDLLHPNKLVPRRKICLKGEEWEERIDLISENGGGD